MKYHTKTGSIYEVADGKVRKLKGGSGTKRVTEDWRPFESVQQLDGCLLIVWGVGRDAISDELGTPEDAVPTRTTLTSPIIEIEP